MKIRNYDPKDKAKLISIYDSARRSELLLAGAPQGFVSLEDADVFAFLSEFSVIVAEISGRIVGFAAYNKDTVGWLYISPVHAHEGIGTMLAKKAIEELKKTGVSPIKINVLKGNTPALNLYSKLGFKQIRTAVGELPSSGISVSVICMELP